MKLDLEDGRILQLPDEMSDESARQLKRLILAHEERTRVAESEVRQLRDEMAALRTQFACTRTQIGNDRSQNENFAAALQALRQEHAEGVKQIVAAVLADRQMVADEFGEYTKSKAVR